MAQLPPSSSEIIELTDSDEARTLGMERWEKLRTAMGRARSLRMYPTPQVGRFTGHCFRGKGGFGVVFEVLDPILERHLALKCCILSDDETCERLMKEAKIMAKFTHPNIVRVYETGWHGNDLFFVMEYVTGSTGLDFMCREPRPSWAEIVRVYQGAGAGLAAVHAQGVVHRDFKPSNILLDDDDWPRLTDFGLSDYDKGSDELDGDDANTGLCGTLSFMAPEVLLGMLPTALSDQWSFCVSLWLTFDLALPFAGDTPEELHEAMRAGPVTHDPSVPQALRAVAKRGLELDPRARFADMKALLEELERVRLLELIPRAERRPEDPTPVLEIARGGFPLPQRRPRRARGVLTVGLSVLVGIVAGGVLFSASSQQLAGDAADPVERLERPEPLRAAEPVEPKTSCTVGPVSVLSMSAELESVCRDIRAGRLVAAAEQWIAIHTGRYPETDDPDFEEKLATLATETKIVSDTFRDAASRQADREMRADAEMYAQALATQYRHDYGVLSSSDR